MKYSQIKAGMGRAKVPRICLPGMALSLKFSFLILLTRCRSAVVGEQPQYFCWNCDGSR